jgi:hypothetical protein
VRAIHLRRLEELKARSKRGMSTSYEAHRNPKREQQEEDRWEQLERENLILLDKIRMARPIESRNRKISRSLREALWRKEQSQIDEENMQLLKRIICKKSSYQVKDMRRDFARHRYELRQRSHHPVSRNSSKKREGPRRSIEFERELLNRSLEVAGLPMQVKMGLVQDRLLIFCQD